jgi:hypothetical protein
MPRKKKVTPAPDADVAGETVAPVTSIIETAKAETVAVIETPAEPATTTSRPQWIQTVNLGRENSGPKMRLGRSERFQQMVIQFDEKPTDETRIHLGEAGWRWRSAEGQWTKQLDFGSRARDQLEAEKLFADIARYERSERGLPTTPHSVSR